MAPGLPRIIATLFIATLAGCAHPPKIAPSAATKITLGAWTVPDEAYFLARIPPPPAPGSAAEQRDIGKVLAAQADITPARVAAAQRTLDLSVFTFAKAIGPDFTAARYPLTAAFFLRLNAVVRRTNNALKAHFQRPHPFEADPRIRRLVDAPARYSYPSYHSARCAVFGRALAKLDPRAAQNVHAIGRQVERDRVFAGEHFPSDIEAGREEGQKIFEALARDPAFRADLARLKRDEWSPGPRINSQRQALDAVQADSSTPETPR